MHKVDQGSVVNAGDSNIDDNPTICEYWVGLFRATHSHNPTLYSHIGVGHITEMVYTVKNVW